MSRYDMGTTWLRHGYDMVTTLRVYPDVVICYAWHALTATAEYRTRIVVEFAMTDYNFCKYHLLLNRVFYC